LVWIAKSNRTVPQCVNPSIAQSFNSSIPHFVNRSIIQSTNRSIPQFLNSLIPLVGLLLWFLVWGNSLFCGEALGLIGDSEKAFGLDGSIRTLFFLLNVDGSTPLPGQHDRDVLSQTILRLTVAGKPTQSLSYELHVVQSDTSSTERIAGGSALTFGNTNTGNVIRYRALDANWNFVQQNQTLCTLVLDRFNVKTSFDWGDVTTGRQAITFGKTYFWNPLDVFFAFGASQFDRDYKPGVDALRADIPLGRFSGINLVGSAGPTVSIQTARQTGNYPQDATWYGSALLGRLFANMSGWDFSLQGGKIFGGWQVGGGAVGDVGPIQIRAELAQFLAMPSESLPPPLTGDLVNSNFQSVIGLGHRFENSLSLDFEYFYNGAGDPNNLNAALVRSQFGSSLQLSRNLVGLSAQYQFTPLVVGQLGTIVSLSDGSTQLQPTVTISLANEMDLLIGAIIGFGPKPKTTGGLALNVDSEFGTLPDTLFLEWKWYF
jgi:hypothetical protein